MPSYYIADSEQELNEHNEQLAQIEQNECDHDWKLKDDSFDHEFGCEQVQYYECVNCEEAKDLE